jgi:hypothetical protein
MPEAPLPRGGGDPPPLPHFAEKTPKITVSGGEALGRLSRGLALTGMALLALVAVALALLPSASSGEAAGGGPGVAALGAGLGLVLLAEGAALAVGLSAPRQPGALFGILVAALALLAAAAAAATVLFLPR